MTAGRSDQEKLSRLLAAAGEAFNESYSPYSSFAVGAAILTEEGLIFTGTNVENRFTEDSICAERSAVQKAVCGGYRQFEAVAVASPKTDLCYPCGACRQYLMEFGDDVIVVLGSPSGEIRKVLILKDLLPFPHID